MSAWRRLLVAVCCAGFVWARPRPPDPAFSHLMGPVYNPKPVRCTPRKSFAPCGDCNNRHALLKALNQCYPLVNAFVNAGAEGLTIDYTPAEEEAFGLGNNLGQYFHNVAMARLANIRLNVTKPFNVSGFRLPSGIVHVPASAGVSRNVSAVQYYCRMCHRIVIRKEFPHTCPGPWVHEDIKGAVHRALADAGVPHEPRHVVLQFRCSDVYYRSGYGMMGWIFYDRALQQIQTQIFRNTTFTVTIIRDPHADEEPFCRVMLRVLTDTIRNFFPCRLQVREAGPLLHDMAQMVHARAFISSISSLGMFVGAACNGLAFVPLSPQSARRAAPCLGNIRWYHGYYWSGSPKVREDPQRAIQLIPTWFAPGLQGLIAKFVAKANKSLALG